MGAITHSVEVIAPLQAVYNQWIRFEEFPRFMGGVKEVRSEGISKLFWKVKIGGKEKHWEAEITEQVPNERIAWRSVEGSANRGAVIFEAVSESTTRVTLTIEYEPEGFIEQAGDALGIPLGQVAEDLNRFRELMEQREEGGHFSRGSDGAYGDTGTDFALSFVIVPGIVHKSEPPIRRPDESVESLPLRSPPACRYAIT
jgi:uncharacterized membrane protein